MAAPLEDLVVRLEAVTNRLESLVKNTSVDEKERQEISSNVQGLAGNSERVNSASFSEEYEAGVSVAAFDEVYNDKVAAYLELSAKIGGDVNTQAELVKKAFAALRQLLCTAESSAKPSDANLPSILKPLADSIGEVSSFRDQNRKSALFNHLSTVSEAIGALGWVSVSPTPGPYVKEMSDAGQFYGNRVLKEYKEKDQDHVSWVRNYQGIWTALIAYIKQHHTTGLTWNSQGGSAPAPPPPGGAPPPPPPVAAPAPVTSDGGDSGGRSALLDALSKGSSVTAGLKKVTNDMKTHKNPALRGSSKVPASSGPPKSGPSSAYAPKPFQASKPGGSVTRPVSVKKPPKKELQAQKKWVVENFENDRNIVIAETTLKQTVYIYNCKECTIIIKGKLNTVTLDSCKKTAVVVDDLIAGLEFVNCQSVQSQINGEVPLVSIDKTDGIQVYLSEKSRDAGIVTAKSSEMNVLVPSADGDFTEYALPEQYKSTWNGKGFTTVPTEST
ncbi:adenylyl cyclase-associated protein 1-like [Dendronephthya gigantea]|uniref:adenylyl cyclase-associated protein 1-like n=1 Tax=Dendronephthya gigantea TaxID=151771 RepID=UPI0010692705|nr:adenylyl cyclase-associated protein 1-like [Dendronephthya gigantea]